MRFQPRLLPTAALQTASLVVLCCIFVASIAEAQRPTQTRLQQQQRRMQKQMEEAQKQMEKAAANAPQLPADPQLLTLHREFITKAEKLAKEYERKKQLEQARETYASMVRLVPNYAEAEAGLQRIRQMQLLKDKKLVEVEADRAWQDSGVVLQKDMPVHFEVRGTWKVVLETSEQGIEIPEKLRPRDTRIKLGSLIGCIANSPSELEKAKPFPIRQADNFVNEKTGRLFLRMYDIDPSDNEGSIHVMVNSTFAK